MNLNWTDIRSINNSQYDGFEELICQLAEYEPIPSGSKFFRKGKPDGGIECFWKFPDGTEWGWQAKFFLNSPNSGQWGEVDKSVKRFLETHPSIIRLTVAIPVDLSDAGKPNQKSAQQKWNDHVVKWQDWSAKKGRKVQFEYWGEHQLLDRLSQDKHRGRIFFWFQQEFLSEKWFNQRINESIADAWPRYTKELDVMLPIAKLFEALGRTDNFYKRLKTHVVSIQNNLPKSSRQKDLSQFMQDCLNHNYTNATEICDCISAIDEHTVDPIDWKKINKLLGIAKGLLAKCREALEEEIERINSKELKKLSKSEPTDTIRYLNSDLYRLGDDLADLEDFIASEEAKLANTPAMLLVGEAGKGKTHLFCDIAEQRNKEQLPTVLLLGEQIRGDAWQQILELLDLSHISRDEFLGALQATAQLRGRKALILIDALNESSDPTMWKKRLRSFLQVIAEYKWISVAISVRSSYEDMVIPEKLQIVRVEHEGFTGVEYEATRYFFNFYKIDQPSIPLLNPEFKTPLFLKILCEGLKNRNLHRIPKGLHGITAVFDFFTNSIFEKLKSPDKMNLSPNTNVVQNAIDRITSTMADRASYWIPVGEAEEIANLELPKNGYTNSLFYHLLSEGLLTKDRFRTEDNLLVEGIRFAYQRLSDHLITKKLLDRYLGNNPADAFKQDAPLKKILGERERWWQFQTHGLIEAMFIQVPERTGLELIAFLDESTIDWFLASAFIESILWRSPNAFSDETLGYVNRCVRNHSLHEKFLDTLLTLAVDPNHPYNADFLHRRLIKDKMAERDAWWSIFLAEQYGQKNSVDRLIDWSWERNDKTHIENESIRLCAVTLTWFLTTSHRFVRDQATKALVNLLSNRLQVLRTILQQFRSVNDAYIIERLLAVAYGCCLRSKNNEEIELIAQDIFDWFFEDQQLPTHILSRDYGRGVIEYALTLGCKIKGDIVKIRPPYQSAWPSIPSKKEIEALKVTDNSSWDSGGKGWAQNWIIHSVMDWDFARYIIGTNIGHSNWLSLKLSEPSWKSTDDNKSDFLDSLNEDQLKSWHIYDSAHQALAAKNWQITVSFSRDILESTLDEIQDEQNSRLSISSALKTSEKKEIAELQELANLAENNFISGLDSEKLKNYKAKIKRYTENVNSREAEPWFDLTLIQHWIVKRVFDLGWTQEKFGLFDRQHGQSQRESHKTERIGKKYQWIAYHEILANLTDNFQFRESYSQHKDRNKYNGPWQLSIRDIDPSCILKSKDEDSQNTSVAWWSPFSFKNWNSPENDVDWIKSISDFPAIQPLLDLINPDDGSQWLNLRSSYSGQQPTPYDKDQYQLDRRDFWFFIKGYLVQKKDVQEISKWASRQNFMGNWMPEGRDFHEVYLGEFFWAPAYGYFDDPYMGEFGWQLPRRHVTDLSKSLLPFWENYIASSGSYDCSVEKGYSVYLPTKQILSDLNLCWNGVEGNYFNSQKELIAFDPATQSNGSNMLLIRKDALVEYLEKNNYSILWTILGEKRVIGGHFNNDDWKGNTTINGVFHFTNEKIEGSLTSKFEPPVKRLKPK